MAIAIISDIHANLEAAIAVYEDIKSQGFDDKRIYCLGDLVGYGPNPAEVIDMAYNWKVCLMGNHDDGTIREPFLFNPAARAALLWTKQVLKPIFLSSASKKRRWEFLEKLPTGHVEDNVLYVHASPREPTMEYILRTDVTTVFGNLSEKIKDIFSKIDWICFIGHTHDPGIITTKGEFIHPQDFNYQPFQLKKDQKYIINVGSVGQPRDGDNRGCYVIFDGDCVIYRRVPYDYHRTIEKMLKIPQIDPRLADRLKIGK